MIVEILLSYGRNGFFESSGTVLLNIHEYKSFSKRYLNNLSFSMTDLGEDEHHRKIW